MLTKINDYDCIHYYFSLPTGLLSLLPGRHQQPPYIVSLRGSDVPGYDPFNKKLQFFHHLLLPLTLRIWKRAKTVVALSDSLKHPASRSTESVPISVIPNGVETGEFPVNSVSRESKNLKLISVARLVERKGIQHILDAMEKLYSFDIHLTIVGKGQFHQVLEDLATSNGIAEKVTFKGYCTSEQVAQLLGEHDLFVLPSMAESFGMVFLEAMSCGLPVIATNIGGIPDIVTRENGILIEPKNVLQLVEAITHFYKNRDELELIGPRNRQKVECEFPWASIADKYLNTYREAIGELPQPQKVIC